MKVQKQHGHECKQNKIWGNTTKYSTCRLYSILIQQYETCNG